MGREEDWGWEFLQSQKGEVYWWSGRCLIKGRTLFGYEFYEAMMVMIDV